MVSMVESSHPAHHDVVLDTAVPKPEPVPDPGSLSSPLSDVEPEPEAETLTQDVAQTQKRKGGRKPIYATSEERKQRNRQAQAAFRERRTEYIRQLETTIKRNEETLQTLQQNHRSAADECLMLRYKNSLLERVLLEKGIDVQAELRLKTGAGGPVKSNPMMSKTTLERAANRNPAQRQQGIAPKEPFGGPQFQGSPSSHISCPSQNKSPGFPMPATMSPTDPSSQQARSQPPQQRNPNQTSPPESHGNAPGARQGTRAPDYYSPFQRHYDQLEQEYDAQADMVDEEHGSVGAPPYVSGFNPASVPGSHGMTNFNPSSSEANSSYGNTNQLLGNYDPMLDADPFGLSASMHFQTPFSYEQDTARH